MNVCVPSLDYGTQWETLRDVKHKEDTKCTGVHAEWSNPLYLNENYLSRTWRCLFLIVMAAYPLVTTLSLRLQDKVGAVRQQIATITLS